MPNYSKITVTLPSAYEEPVTMLMLEQGAEGVEIFDPALIQEHLAAGDWDASVFDDVELPLGSVTLSCLLPGEEAAARPLLDAIAALAGQAGFQPEPRLEPIAGQDWQQKWKEAFQPLLIGERFFVRPYWDETPAPAGRVAVVVDPGMAFGTGDHATTAMMLEMIEEYLLPGDRVIDFGCGSGILGLAALALGASDVSAVDIDPICADVTARHLELNPAATGRFESLPGDILCDEKLQRRLRRNKGRLVLANINGQVVADLAQVVTRFIQPGGFFLCSGIIAEQGGEMAAKLAANSLTILKSREQDGWCAFAVTPSYE